VRRRSGRGTRIAAIVAPDERVAGKDHHAFAATPILPGFNEPIAGGAAIGSLLCASRGQLVALRTPWR
jgi:hypothetical protein